MSYRSLWVTVSRSRTSQYPRVLQSTPRLMRERQRQLVRRQGGKVGHLAHQLNLGQSAWREHHWFGTSFRLGEEDRPRRIKCQLNRAPTVFGADVVQIATQG